MARPLREPPSPSTLPPLVYRALEAAGIDSKSLGQGAASGCLSGPEAAERLEADTLDVTRSEIEELFVVAVELLGEPFLALRLAGETSSRKYGHAELAARASDTVGEALTRVASCGPLVHAGFAWSFEKATGRFRQEAPEPQRRASRHLTEYGLAFALTQARRAAGASIAVRSAWFAHARPADLAPIHHFFETRDLTFGLEDSGFTLEPASVVLSVPTGDARLLATATDLAEAALRRQAPPSFFATASSASRVFTNLVTGHVARRLAENPSMDDVALALHMSPRTLQRRLVDEEARFSELVDLARQARARELITDPGLTLAEIAVRLGFSELATFSRAFKRWTGKPPGAFRRRG